MVHQTLVCSRPFVGWLKIYLGFICDIGFDFVSDILRVGVWSFGLVCGLFKGFQCVFSVGGCWWMLVVGLV